MFVLALMPEQIGRSQAASSSAGSGSHPIAEDSWQSAPFTELQKNAQAGNAEAQYWYWARQLQAAYEDQDRRRTNMVYSTWWKVSRKDQMAADSKWRNASDGDLESAANHGDVGAQVFLDMRRINQEFQRANEAFPWLERSAEQGFPRAEFSLAARCLGWSGGGFAETNQPKGLEFLRRAADHGWVAAQYRLAKSYIKGELLPPDLARAVEYLQRSADQGSPGAQYELARLYAAGEGEPRSEADSPLSLIRKSAKAGWNLALEALADRYRTGLGVPKDYVRASRYYQAAREADSNHVGEGDSKAAAVFALLDENLQPRRAPPMELAGQGNSPAGIGFGALPSAPSAEFYGFAKVLGVYLKATERKDPSAMNQIGEWYLAGRFVPKEPAAAYRWFSVAADAGAPGASARRDEIKNALTPEQAKEKPNPDEL